MYSFVLTAEDSHWRFCFCRYDFEANSIMIILTRLPWHENFFNMLIKLSDLKQRQSNDFHVFLTNCYKAAVPPRGEITLVPVGASRKVISSLFYKEQKYLNLYLYHNIYIYRCFPSSNHLFINCPVFQTM